MENNNNALLNEYFDSENTNLIRGIHGINNEHSLNV